MKFYYITFRSVTFAQKGERALKQAGLDCVLQRTPRELSGRRCGYCLRLRTADVMPAVQLLRAAQVPFRRVYVQTLDGEVEEVRL